jgi:23S rRNA pseudouridine955/2504/2580 synthase
MVLSPLRRGASQTRHNYVKKTIMTKWQTNIREENLPLHEALALRVPTAPTAFLRQLCKKQRVTIDGTIAEAERLTRAGETIVVKASQRWLECLAKLPVKPEQILYEDSACMVLNKPAGLAIHRAEGHEDNLLHRVQDFLYLRKETFQVSPTHRLDIGTSGAVLFGKGRATISQLGQMIMAGQLSKSYLALVSGKLTPTGELDCDVPAKGKSKASLTKYKSLAAVEDYTLLELELITGRHHQIRYQLASTGHPIIGDARYRGKIINELNRPFLHCHLLTFPLSKEERIVTVKSPLPEDLQRLLLSLGFAPDTLAL